MGVDGLTRYLQNKCAFYRVDLSNSMIGIDGCSLVWFLHDQLDEPHNFDQLNSLIESFFCQLLDHNIEAIVWFDEDIGEEEYKRETHLNRLAQKKEQVIDYVDYWEKGIYEKNTKFPLRGLALVQMQYTLQRLDITYHIAAGEADPLLVQAALDGTIQYILSSDSDMVFGGENLNWCRIQDLDLPCGNVVSTERILKQTNLSLNQWTRVGLWAGTDVTKPHLCLLPTNRPRVLELIIEWVKTGQDLAFLRKQDEEFREIWDIGERMLDKNNEETVFDGIPGLGSIIKNHTIHYSCWYSIHSQTEIFVKPLINYIMYILKIEDLTVFETEEKIELEDPSPDFCKIVSLNFETFANSFIEIQMKKLKFENIPPYVWTVWVEQMYTYHRLITLLCFQPNHPAVLKYPKPSQIESIKIFFPPTRELTEGEVFARKVGNELPILNHKPSILDEIEQQDIIMISASTGSGKSSQVPQWLIDLDPKFNIIVTQPRRLSTIRICDWVSRCRGEQIGGTIGYRIGHGAAKVSPQTRLTFCTAGYLTERLLHQPGYLSRFQFICLDEVHERSLEMDLLLKIVKERQEEYGYKIVLMSATLNAHILQDYFDVNRRPIEIETQLYNVEIFYTDTVKEILPKIIPPEITKTMQYLDNCNYDTRCYGAISRYQVNMVVYLVRTLARKGHSTLVFLSGISLILDVASRISEFRSPYFRVVILHSSVVIDDSEIQPEKDKYNIFLASDVAESSITLDDCDLVIDLCISREIVVDSGRQVLKSVWSSRDSVKQRKGRTGRVMPGRCIRCIPSSLFEELQENGDPEILKMLPSELAYRLKTSLNSAIIPMTKELPTIPYEEDLADAIQKLNEWGILTSENDDEAVLTPMGKQMSKIPLDLRGSQMVITSLALGVAHDIIILASLLSIDQDPFCLPHPLKHPNPVEYAREMKKVVATKKLFDQGHLSEAFVYISLFHEFKKIYKHKRQHQLVKWCREHCVYKSRMTLWAHIVSRVATSISDDFTGKRWLMHEPDRPPERVEIPLLRLFILLFGEVHQFQWSGKGKMVFCNVPEIFDDPTKLRACLKMVLGQDIFFGEVQKSGKKLKITAIAHSYLEMLPLLRMKNGKPFIHLPLHPSEEGLKNTNDLERKAVKMAPFHDVQLAVPSPIVSKSNLVIVESNTKQLVIIDRTFPWLNHDNGYITYCSARYVRNVVFPSGVTVLKDINVSKWERVKGPPEDTGGNGKRNNSEAFQLHQRLQHIKTNAIPDVQFLQDLLYYVYENAEMRRNREKSQRSSRVRGTPSSNRNNHSHHSTQQRSLHHSRQMHNPTTQHIRPPPPPIHHPYPPNPRHHNPLVGPPMRQNHSPNHHSPLHNNRSQTGFQPVYPFPEQRDPEHRYRLEKN